MGLEVFALFSEFSARATAFISLDEEAAAGETAAGFERDHRQCEEREIIFCIIKQLNPKFTHQ